MAGRKRFGASGLRPPASTQSAEEDAAIAAIHSHLKDENISVTGAALASPVTNDGHVAGRLSPAAGLLLWPGD